jgi:hypothetical protein
MAITDKVESPPMIVGGGELVLDAARPIREPATGEVIAHVPGARAVRADAMEEHTAIGQVVPGRYDAVSTPRERE